MVFTGHFHRLSVRSVARLFDERHITRTELAEEMHENMADNERIEVPVSAGGSCCQFACKRCPDLAAFPCAFKLLNHLWEQHKIKIFLKELPNFAANADSLPLIRCEACGEDVPQDDYAWNAHLRYEHLVPMRYLGDCAVRNIPVSVYNRCQS